MLVLGFWMWVGILKRRQPAPFSLVLVFSGCAEMVCGLLSGTLDRWMEADLSYLGVLSVPASR